VNESRTCDDVDTGLTQDCSGFDPTPESMGAMAALTAKANFQGRPHLFADPIHIRRSLIAKRQEAGADTAYGHTCSNIIEILENLFDYERPAWAQDDRQALPGLMNVQIERLARLTSPQ